MVHMGCGAWVGSDAGVPAFPSLWVPMHQSGKGNTQHWMAAIKRSLQPAQPLAPTLACRPGQPGSFCTKKPPAEGTSICRRPAAPAARLSRPFQAPRKLQPASSIRAASQPSQGPQPSSQGQPQEAAGSGPDRAAPHAGHETQGRGTQSSQGPLTSQGRSQQAQHPAAARLLHSVHGRLVGRSRRAPRAGLQVGQGLPCSGPACTAPAGP